MQDDGPRPPSDRLRVVLAGHAGDLATLHAALTDQDADVLAAALSGLARCSALDASTLEAAIRGQGRAHPSLARLAIELAPGVPGDPGDALDVALVELLTGTDHILAEVAGWALGERRAAPDEDPHDTAGPGGVDGATDPLLPIVTALAGMATGHQDALCREAAVAALGSIGHEEGRGAVLQAMTDKATVRRRAVIALAAFDGTEVDAALVAALTDRDWQVRQAAEDLQQVTDAGS